jgi:hypothetical protein
MSLIALTALAAAAGGQVPVLYAQVVIEQRSVVRIRPVLPNVAVQPRWQEKKGPHCVPMNMLAGALVSSANTVDLILRGGVRLRAKLEKSCSSIDFYQGFYVKPNKDGRICEDRDSIRSRVGGECEIKDFKLLVAGK